MHLKAYFTVENSVIVPIFFFILFLFVMLALNMHDSLIVKSVDVQAAMKIEQELSAGTLGDKKAEDAKNASLKKQVYANVENNIREKSVLDTKSDSNDTEKRINTEDYIENNNHGDLIRVIRAGLKLIGR